MVSSNRSVPKTEFFGKRLISSERIEELAGGKSTSEMLDELATF